MTRLLPVIFALLFLNTLAVVAQETQADYPVELCNVTVLISTMMGTDGPLDRCRPGDVVHFQIDPTRVAYSTVVARYCNLRSGVMVETHRTNPLNVVHVVCEYQWKWAKEVEPKQHPDNRN